VNDYNPATKKYVDDITAADISVTPSGGISSTDVQSALVELDSDKEPANANIQAHIANFNNPHHVTKAQLGLGSVTDDQQLSLKMFNEAEDQATNLTTGFVQRVSVNYNFLDRTNYILQWYCELSHTSGSGVSEMQAVLDKTTELGIHQQQVSSANAFYAVSGFYRLNLPTPGSHTLTINFRKVSGNPANGALIKRARLLIIKA
jgi:hypothetical protein